MPLNDILNKITELKSDHEHKKTFAEFVDESLHGQLVEIYWGDAYEEISTDQISQQYPAVFCGRVDGAYREVLLITCAYVDKKTRKIELGKLIFINERAIRALTVVDGNGLMQDMFLRSRETMDVLNHIKGMHANEKPIK